MVRSLHASRFTFSGRQDPVGGKSAELDNTHMTTGSDAVDWHNQHNHMDNGDGFIHHDDNILVADGITQRGDHNQITNEGGVERRDRGNNMGLGLQRLNRARRGKLQVVITEGNIRPVVPLVAAKFASECNIIVRNHVPILPHWKLYKREPRSRSKEKEPKEKEPTSAYIDLFLGKLKAKFDINIEDETVEKACIEMMKSAVRQQRYRLKQDYFDPFPLHLDDKCNEEEPNALDLFKVLHYSKKKKCYTPAIQEAITRMENKLSTTQGENPKSAAQVVAEVLAENTKKNQFL